MGFGAAAGVSSAAELPLPTRDGVGPSCVALSQGPWATITDYLVERFPAQPRALWLQRMASCEVVDEHGVPVTPTRVYQAPLRLYYYREVPQETPIPFYADILHQDEHLLVLDKPHFLPVTPSGNYLQETALVRLKRALGLNTIVPIHRIDRDTAGLVLFSLQPSTRDHYQRLFREHRVNKSYEAIAPWSSTLEMPLVRSSRIGPSAHFMQHCELTGPANARTHVELLQRQGELGFYRLRPVSGHQHQLRVHMAALGIPILNDGIYPVLTPEGAADYSRPLQLLARSLEFTDPLSGVERQFSSRRVLALAGRFSSA